ncbi:hypothetical protein PQX77_006704 [Marasmius sp. AFHP31]|nr:hypothetical protein PQX77_006704 [Marasmius sp. AFHP31]
MGQGESDIDMSEISDTDTMCSGVSDTQTVVEPEPEVQPAAEDFSYLKASPLEPYLTQKRINNFVALKQRYPRMRALLPPPLPIEFSFNEFTSALDRTYLVAQLTPPHRTLPGSPVEFQDVGRRLNIALDDSVPTTQHETKGNVLEIKRMLFMSITLWARVWDRLPDGTDKRTLYKDIAKFIEQKARMRWEEEMVEQRMGNDVFAYHDVDWRVIMEGDLSSSKWQGWREGAPE